MHELGIAQSILDTVTEVVSRQGAGTPTCVGVRIGPLAAVDSQSLSFCFDVLAEDSQWKGLRLNIEQGEGDDLTVRYLEMQEETS